MREGRYFCLPFLLSGRDDSRVGAARIPEGRTWRQHLSIHKSLPRSASFFSINKMYMHARALHFSISFRRESSQPSQYA